MKSRRRMRRLVPAGLAALVAALAAGVPSPGPTLSPTARGDDTPKTAEWTVMIFLNADNNLEKYGVNDFLEMAKVGSTKDVNIVVQFDRHPKFDKRYGDWTQTLRFRVEKDMEPTEKNAVEDIGEADMGSGKVLADFVRWAQKKYPAKKYMLVIWDHGQGWRFQNATQAPGTTTAAGAKAFTDVMREKLRIAGLKVDPDHREPRLMPENRLDLEVKDLPEHWVLPGVYKYCSIDETSGTKLFNRDIQDHLPDALGGKKLDVIGFDACLMQMIETAFAMRKVATVMVASEELEPGNGWDYSIWLAKLVAKPTMAAEELGKVLVDAYEKSYVADPETTLSAVRLAPMDDLAKDVSNLADESRKQLSSVLPNIKKARHLCANFAPGDGLHGIDLSWYCEQLVADGTADKDLRGRAADVQKRLQAAVIANYAGKSRKDAPFGSRGLAIYFPLSNTDYKSDPDGPAYTNGNKDHPVEFVQVHTWDDFLHEYFKVVP